ncbi:hypothetical protein [Candidatus Enterococcus ferrettii]|uniref:DUF2975 domain-containing protein n=1 Tax=Candidatus Enterococcus ferrettii TaxID=2815324 RepID=A0ABV0ESV6_9ENTE|nr:hypothetical protein [Enterococcus sp. 665A]MBO1341524.1 hypothetical protein [Enterococcus sp. 665A]
MDLKKSRDTFWIIDGIFKLLAIGSLCMGIYLAVQLLVYKNSIISGADKLVILVFYSGGPLTAHQQAITNALSMLPQLLVWTFAFWSGSKIFYDLSEGLTPFSETMYKRIDRIAKAILWLGFLQPQIYSLFASLVSGKFSWSLSLNLTLVMGLVLYSISAIFRYAISLQELADDTV